MQLSHLGKLGSTPYRESGTEFFFNDYIITLYTIDYHNII